MRIGTIKSKVVTLWCLGAHNLVWVVVYRLALKLGLITRNMQVGSCIKGPFFDTPDIIPDETLTSLELKVFGLIEYSKQVVPVWNCSITTGALANVQQLHWSKISDFDLDIGDIKTVWELSRFDWLLYFSVEYLKTGDSKHLASLNEWLASWSENNPVNQGVNWKCGQEASMRVMHLCLASFLLKQHESLSNSVIEMLEQHLTRISPTVLYAMAQDNNHGSSEAVALFIGGVFLEHNSNAKQASKWKKQGLFWLENRTRRLISNDGSFSQHSVNYHRVMLDSLCVAELIRGKFDEPEFSPQLHSKLKLAVSWLGCFTDSDTGDVPNLGANDGARLIPLCSSGYRDYRPTVQLASALFLKERFYTKNGPYNQILKLLDLGVSQTLSVKPGSKVFSQGGYVYLEKSIARCYMRYPVFKFRPSQCDVFHIDFWLGGRNILRDAGTYSYNTEEKWLDYFPSTAAHNTVQFDGNEQMPRVSRFLYSDWLKASHFTGLDVSGKKLSFSAAYTNKAIQHKRSVHLSESELIVVDDISGFVSKAVLRWRLAPGTYEVLDNVVKCSDFELSICGTTDISRFEIVEGWESRFYLKKTELPVLEIEVVNTSVLTTSIKWNIS